MLNAAQREILSKMSSKEPVDKTSISHLLQRYNILDRSDYSSLLLNTESDRIDDGK